MYRDCWVADGQFKELAELSGQPYFFLKFATLVFIKFCLYKAVFSCRNVQDVALFSKIIL